MAEILTTIWHFILGAGLFIMLWGIVRILAHPSVIKFLLILMGVSLFFGGDDDDFDC